LGRHNDKNIKEVLNDFLASNQRVAKGYYISHIDKVWKQEMGPIISSYTSRIYFKDGALNVYLTSAPLKKELSLSKDKVIHLLNAALGNSIIQSIEFY
jgi:hypothetical protein